MKKTLAIVLILTLINLIIVIAFQYLFNAVVDIIDDRYFYSGNDLGGAILLINLFFTSWAVSLLVLHFRRYFLAIILAFEITATVIWNSVDNLFFYRWPEKVGDKWWWHDYFHELKYVLPFVILIALSIYGIQMLIGRKFLPERYKSSLR